MATEREMICLRFLSDKVKVTAAEVGRAIYDETERRRLTRVPVPARNGGSNLAGIGASVLGALQRRGLVERAPNTQQWRITVYGHNVLHTSRLPPV